MPIYGNYGKQQDQRPLTYDRSAVIAGAIDRAFQGMLGFWDTIDQRKKQAAFQQQQLAQGQQRIDLERQQVAQQGQESQFRMGRTASRDVETSQFPQQVAAGYSGNPALGQVGAPVPLTAAEQEALTAPIPRTYQQTYDTPGRILEAPPSVMTRPGEAPAVQPQALGQAYTPLQQLGQQVQQRLGSQATAAGLGAIGTAGEKGAGTIYEQGKGSLDVANQGVVQAFESALQNPDLPPEAKAVLQKSRDDYITAMGKVTPKPAPQRVGGGSYTPPRIGPGNFLDVAATIDMNAPAPKGLKDRVNPLLRRQGTGPVRTDEEAKAVLKRYVDEAALGTRAKEAGITAVEGKPAADERKETLRALDGLRRSQRSIEKDLVRLTSVRKQTPEVKQAHERQYAEWQRLNREERRLLDGMEDTKDVSLSPSGMEKAFDILQKAGDDVDEVKADALLKPTGFTYKQVFQWADENGKFAEEPEAARIAREETKEKTTRLESEGENIDRFTRIPKEKKRIINLSSSAALLDNLRNNVYASSDLRWYVEYVLKTRGDWVEPGSMK